VGSYVDASGQEHGFLWDDGVFTPIDVPDAEHTTEVITIYGILRLP
jgi:hypothetical protein